ncbi:MAG: hypothetical protein GXO62_06700 [Epsilonproteobacteria bacterium]|nr:hypothetical protein [Campylobacterota bacterium]
MKRVVLEVDDNVYKGLEFLKIKEVKIIDDYEFWSEEELKNFGKYTYGLSSDDFDENLIKE